jgi:arabinofuranosyltransferase
MKGWGERRILSAILLAGFILRIVFVVRSAPTDDAYITFRYARNLAAGLGFVYNGGERVLGTTTPLFTLVLAPFALAGIPLDVAARGIAIVADLATTIVLYRLLRGEFGREIAVFGAAVYGLFYATAAACGYGMETQLFILLLSIALACAVTRRPLGAATAAALSALTRPEGFLLTGILAVEWLVRGKRRSRSIPWRPLGLFLALLLPWILFASIYFGSAVPNSLLAKFRQQDVAFLRWTEFFLTRNPMIVLLWLGALIGAVVAILRRSRTGILLTAWAACYPLFFLAGRPPFLGVWYFPPLVPALAGLFAIGAISLAGMIVRSGRTRGILVGAAWLLLVAIALPRNLESARWGKTLADTVYRPLAAWVSAHTGPNDLVQVSDIGYVGYFTGRKILDSSALVSPEVATYYRMHRDDPARDVHYVLERLPAVVILPVGGDVIDRFAGGGLLGRYHPVRRFRTLGTAAVDELPRAAAGASGTRRFEADFIALERSD